MIDQLNVYKINNNQNKAIVLLHGYGANGQDLASIESVVNFGKSYNWYFIEAPIELPMGFGMKSLAWFEISEDMFLKSDPSYFENFAKATPIKFDNSFLLLRNTFSVIVEQSEEVMLGGFSQGSMMALHLFHELSDDQKSKILQLTLFSSVRCGLDRLGKFSDVAKDFKIFQSHGRRDMVLPYSEGVKLNEYLSNIYKVKFVDFDGAHEIPVTVLREWEEFICSNL